MNLTDTHCHLDLPKFDPDRTGVLQRAAEAGLTRILVPGLTVVSSRGVVALARSRPELYAAVGVHPTEAGGWESGSARALEALAAEAGSKVVAIGEIGLDAYWDAAPPDLQLSVLREQLTLAAALRLPVLLHLREARDDRQGTCARLLLDVLETWAQGLESAGSPLAGRAGVLHAFSGSLEIALQAIELGFYIGLGGPVTFENARLRQEIAGRLPLERLLLETDSPFLAPHPLRGRRNEPSYLRLIADKIALIRACPPEEIGRVTSGNAQRLFGWDTT